MKCPKCGIEMDNVGDWSNSQVDWNDTESYTLYQCPNCKRVKIEEWNK